MNIANTINPDHLIVEPTPVGSLTNIKNNLNKIAYESVEILKPICIVDGISVLNGTCQFNDIFIDQIKQSFSIFVSKIKKINSEEKDFVYKKLHALNSISPIYRDDYKTFSKEFFLDFLKDLSERKEMVQEKKMVEIKSVSFTDIKIPNPVFLINLLDEISMDVHGDIKRAKGFFSDAARCYQFHYADSPFDKRV